MYVGAGLARFAQRASRQFQVRRFIDHSTIGIRDYLLLLVSLVFMFAPLSDTDIKFLDVCSKGHTKPEFGVGTEISVIPAAACVKELASEESSRLWNPGLL
ncbi:MAG: hypothetical protein R3C59_24465 [Planctomycetaceae bacterium]